MKKILRSYSIRFLVTFLTGSIVSLAATQTTFAAELLAGIAENGRLILFASDAPDDVDVIKVKGLQRGETLLGVDTRPATGDLYALGSSARLYTIDVGTGEATAIGTAPFTNTLSGDTFGFDFNPTVDRIRLVSDSGLNLRLHPDTGIIAATDTGLAYPADDAGGGSIPQIVGSAYINNDTNPATATVLFGIDANRDVLVVQNPPNAGTLRTVGSLGVDVTGVAGFDVAGSDGTAYASLIVETDKHGKNARAGLYSIDLVTGEATFLGKIGGPKPLTSLTSLGSIE